MLLQLATLKFVARQVACGGGNTGNKALQLAKQQCCATSCKEMLLVLLHLYGPMDLCFSSPVSPALARDMRSHSSALSEPQQSNNQTKVSEVSGEY